AFGSRYNLQEYNEAFVFANSLVGQAYDRLRAMFRTPIVMKPGAFDALPFGSLERSVRRECRPATVANQHASDLTIIADICREYTLLCVFITQPNAYSERAPETLRAKFWMTPPNEKYTVTLRSLEHITALYNGFLKTWAAAQGFPVIDLAARIEPSFRSFYDDMHFNESGAVAVVDVIATELGAIFRAQCEADRKSAMPLTSRLRHARVCSAEPDL